MRFPILSAMFRPGKSPDAVARSRLMMICVLFVGVYLTICAKLALVGMEVSPDEELSTLDRTVARPDIVDRNGALLATDLPVLSLFAEPRKVIDADEASETLAEVLGNMSREEIYKRLKSRASFVWLKRGLTPDQANAIKRLGIPAIGFRGEVRRFYPQGRETSHVLGLTDIDNSGISGFEKWLDQSSLGALRKSGLMNGAQVESSRLTIDTRIQHIVHEVLDKAMEQYHPSAAGAVILNAKTGEVISLVSLPDFDPDIPAEAAEKDRLNRVSGGVFEMGSTIKTFTTAMALELGHAKLTTIYDASHPLVIGSQVIHDAHSKGKPLSLVDVFLQSSNIGSAREAIAVGMENHKAFLERSGLFSKVAFELPEVATPVSPRVWRQVNSLTSAFGHGFATTPLQTAVGIAAILNHGRLVPPTLMPRGEDEARALSVQMVSEKTSEDMRYLFRLNAVKGSGRKANVPGFRVGGKTGTAEKVINGRYSHNNNFNAFAAALPMEDPAFVLLVFLDDPRPEFPGAGITSAANAVPVASTIIERSALLLGVRPLFDDPDDIVSGLSD